MASRRFVLYGYTASKSSDRRMLFYNCNAYFFSLRKQSKYICCKERSNCFQKLLRLLHMLFYKLIQRHIIDGFVYMKHRITFLLITYLYIHFILSTYLFFFIIYSMISI